MKNVALYLLLLLAVPAMAQPGHHGGHHHHHSHSHQHPQVYAMDPEDFEAALNIISRETFDFKRLEVAKMIVCNNWVSARQIANICKLFTYDYNRVEFAKYAYGSCVDKGMYFLLDDTFIYNFSKEELHDYILDINSQ